MSDLRSMQRRLYAALVTGDESDVLPCLHGAELQASARLQVYRNNIYEGFRRTLAAAYPAIERLVGQGCFRGLALSYFHEFPSRSGDLDNYGRDFAALLRRRYEHSVFDYLVDVARLEWAYQEVLMAPDAAVLLPEAIEALSPSQREQLHLHIHPAARLVGSSYPILKIWRANRVDGDASVTFDLAGGSETVMLVRTAGSVELHLLEAGERRLFEACANGRSLTAAALDAFAVEPDLDFSHTLKRAFARASFSHYTLAQP